MRMMCICLIVLLAVGCIGLRINEERAAHNLGMASVYVASKAGVNDLELAAIRPIVADAVALLAAEASDRPVVLADALRARLDALAINMDDTDAAFARAALINFLCAIEIKTDPDAERAAEVAVEYLGGVLEGIDILLK